MVHRGWVIHFKNIVWARAGLVATATPGENKALISIVLEVKHLPLFPLSLSPNSLCTYYTLTLVPLLSLLFLHLSK